jgi:nicotinamidase-related amidase
MDEYTRPDPERAALLTVDVQNDFTRPGAPAEVEGTAEAVPLMRRLVEAFRDADAPVVHVVRLYRADGSNVDRWRRWRGCGSAGARSASDRRGETAPPGARTFEEFPGYLSASSSTVAPPHAGQSVRSE